MEDEKPYAPPRVVDLQAPPQVADEPGLSRLDVNRGPLFAEESEVTDGYFLDTDYVKQMGKCKQILECHVAPVLQSPEFIFRSNQGFCYCGVPGKVETEDSTYLPKSGHILKIETRLESKKMIVVDFNLAIEDTMRAYHPVDWQRIGELIWPL